MVVTYQMAPFANEWKQLRIKELLELGSFYKMCKSLHKPTDNNSNTINITPTESLPGNTTVTPN